MSNASPNAEPIAAPPQRTENLALIVVCAAQFVLQLDFSVVNVALPSIKGGLGFSDSDLQWIVTGYALTFGALLLFGGRAGDLFGQRRMLLLGLVLFGVGSIGGGLAPTPEALIAARFVQGAAGALISPAALSSLTLLFPDGAGRIRALGIWQGATAAGGTAGIVLGGLLVEVLGWRSVFIINVPIVIALVVLVPRVIPRPATRQHVSLHLGPSVLITAAIALVIFALSNLEQSGPTSIVTLVPFIAGLGVAAVFVVTQKRSHDPLIPKVVLRSRQRRGALVVMLIAGAVLAAYVYFVSLYLQTVLGLSPLLTGVSLLPATLTIVVLSSFIARRVIERIGLKSTTIIGALLVAAGQTWFVSVSSTGDYLLNVLPALVLTACRHRAAAAGRVDRRHRGRRSRHPGRSREPPDDEPAGRSGARRRCAGHDRRDSDLRRRQRLRGVLHSVPGLRDSDDRRRRRRGGDLHEQASRAVTPSTPSAPARGEDHDRHRPARRFPALLDRHQAALP